MTQNELNKAATRYFDMLRNAQHESLNPHNKGAMSWYLGVARGLLLGLHDTGALRGAEFAFWMFGILGEKGEP